ncbi:MAG: aldehyde dehydrogenase family protein [Alphaproteobacteria bacterium]|nr:aldehyde dehydrogenase family protein [Alphaproteobacteria bacterium]
MNATRPFAPRRLSRAGGPLYRQAAAQLRAAIAAGRLPVGADLPTEAALAAGCGVSLITIRHALRELEQEGMIRKRAAKAAVVVANAPRQPAARPLNSIEDVVAATTGAELRIGSFGPRRSAERAPIGDDFDNTPDSDPALPATREWAARAVTGARPEPTSPHLAITEAVDDVVDVARTAQQSWAARPATERADLLRKAAREIDSRREQLLAVTGCCGAARMVRRWNSPSPATAPTATA